MRASSQFLNIAGNFKTFQQVMERYGAARKKSYPEVITRAAWQANKRCTFSEAKGGVKRAKIKDKYLGNSADPTKWKKVTRTKTGKKRKGSGQNPKERRMWFSLAAKQGAKKGKPKKTVRVSPYKRTGEKLAKVGKTIKNISEDDRHLTKVAATIRNRRRSRAGAMAAGFLVSARRTAYKKVKGARNIQPFKNGSASKSVFHAPTENNLKAFTINKVLGDYEIGRKAMLRAMTFTMADMNQHAQKLLNKLGDEAARKSKGGRR